LAYKLEAFQQFTQLRLMHLSRVPPPAPLPSQWCKQGGGGTVQHQGVLESHYQSTLCGDSKTNCLLM